MPCELTLSKTSVVKPLAFFDLHPIKPKPNDTIRSEQEYFGRLSTPVGVFPHSVQDMSEFPKYSDLAFSIRLDWFAVPQGSLSWLKPIHLLEEGFSS